MRIDIYAGTLLLLLLLITAVVRYRHRIGIIIL